MPIGNDQVFLPQPVDPARDTLAFDGEDQLRTEFGARVTHQRITFANTPIAISRAIADTAPDVPIILSCSGNAADRQRSGVSYAAKLLPFGEAVLFDYPGYGDSGGQATPENIDAIAGPLMDWLEAEAADRPLILWGHSLGGFVCGELAARSSAVDAIVLETTARNVSEVGRAWKPWWAPVRLKPDPGLAAFDTANALKGFAGDILILGAGRDSVLPVGLHRSLAKALPRATYLELENATHYSAGFDPQAVDAVATLIAGL